MSSPLAMRHGHNWRALLFFTFLTLVMAMLVTRSEAPAGAQVLGPVPGGPVLLDGNDPADHTPTINTYMADVFANLEANIAGGFVHNGQVAVVGSCGSVLTGADATLDVVEHTTALAVEGLFSNIGTNNYQIVHICSDDDGTLSTAVEDELDRWGSAIAAHVNRGGGLFSTGHSYNWLSDLFPGLSAPAGGTSSSYVTADGDTFFATLNENDNLNAVNHYTFTGVASTPLLTLLTESANGVGQIVAIGGTTVRFPQIIIEGPTSAEVGTTATFDLVAADADGNALSSTSFDWEITGVTPSTGSGSDVTDGQGEFSFSFSGTSAGTTRLSVDLNLGSGASAGAAITTTWANLPGAPVITSADDAVGTDRAADLAWNAPASDGGKAITDYVIQYSTDGGSTWSTFDDGTSTATADQVDGLADGVAHQFRVAAVNGVGQGPWSTPESATPVGTPTAPDLHSFEAGDEEVAVDWDEPTSTGGFAITHYVVEYALRDSGSWITWGTTPTATALDITGIDNDTWYDVRVAAVNAEGQGPWSNVLEVSAFGVPTEVQDLEVMVGDNEVATVVWSEPAFDGGSDITDYVVTTSTGDTCDPEEFTPEGSSDVWYRCRFAGVDSGTDFSVTVAAVNSRGTGEVGEADSTVASSCLAPYPTGTPAVGPFNDVTQAWQLDAVEWARLAALTYGVSDGRFAPQDQVTRFQVVTLLWRAFDSPAPTEAHAFTDTEANDAVAWASEKGYVLGVTPTEFRPWERATRIQWLTVLWRATCSPPSDGNNPFIDVTNPNYIDPALWGASTGVTRGRIPSQFEPLVNITRGEAVTMLYRWITGN